MCEQLSARSKHARANGCAVRTKSHGGVRGARRQRSYAAQEPPAPVLPRCAPSQRTTEAEGNGADSRFPGRFPGDEEAPAPRSKQKPGNRSDAVRYPASEIGAPVPPARRRLGRWLSSWGLLMLLGVAASVGYRQVRTNIRRMKASVLPRRRRCIRPVVRGSVGRAAKARTRFSRQRAPQEIPLPRNKRRSPRRLGPRILGRDGKGARAHCAIHQRYHGDASLRNAARRLGGRTIFSPSN